MKVEEIFIRQPTFVKRVPRSRMKMKWIRQVIMQSCFPVLQDSVDILFVPQTNHKIGDRAFAVATPRAWNQLPTDLKLQQSTTALIFGDI